MTKLQVKLLHDHATIPEKKTSGAAGYDLTVVPYPGHAYTDPYYYEIGSYITTIYTGVAVKIPDTHYGLLTLRSSMSKRKITMPHGVGTIDCDYTGELLFKIHHTLPNPQDMPLIQFGERIGQLILIEKPELELEVVDELPDTERGENGFGSTGK